MRSNQPAVLALPFEMVVGVVVLLVAGPAYNSISVPLLLLRQIPPLDLPEHMLVVVELAKVEIGVADCGAENRHVMFEVGGESGTSILKSKVELVMALLELLAIGNTRGGGDVVEVFQLGFDFVVGFELLYEDDFEEFGLPELGAGDEGAIGVGVLDDIIHVLDVEDVLFGLANGPGVRSGAEGVDEAVATMVFGPDAARKLDDVGGDWGYEFEASRKRVGN